MFATQAADDLLEHRRVIGPAPERVAAVFLLSACSPLVITAAVAVAMLSRRSPFVQHLRVGRGGSRLWVWKLRTMWTAERAAADEKGWVQRIVAEPAGDYKNPRDQRVTSRFAAFCRKHSIDELPQLWNVVMGQMSLVGPRPLTRSELRHYAGQQNTLLSVKPGLTGLWQTQGRGTLDWARRVELDLALARAITVRQYWSVVLRTVPSVIHGNGAW